MNIALDASVAIKLYVLEDLHDAARRLVTEADMVFAPDFLLAEVCNIAWKKVRRNEIDTVQAREFPAALRRLLTLYPTVAFVERALGIALTLDHPVYDCLYLACAEANDGVVVTADKRFWRAVQQTAFAGLVRHLDDAPP